MSAKAMTTKKLEKSQINKTISKIKKKRLHKYKVYVTHKS